MSQATRSSKRSRLTARISSPSRRTTTGQTKAMELLAQSRTNKRNIEAFQMFLNDRSVTDIAAELGMAENSVHQAVSRCRRFLTERRKMLEELL